MCGRFSLVARLNTILAQFAAQAREPENYPLFDHYNIAPTTLLPIVRLIERERVVSMARWGLIPSWTKIPESLNKLRAEKGLLEVIKKLKLPLHNNARGETVKEKPTFRTAFKKRRCIIPATGFYEWVQDYLPKQPYYFQRRDSQLLAFAGIWETWQVLDTFSIITGDPNSIMKPIHDRLPVILGPNDYSAWLDPTSEDVSYMLTPCPSDELFAFPVSSFVNSSRNQGGKCIEPTEFDLEHARAG